MMNKVVERTQQTEKPISGAGQPTLKIPERSNSHFWNDKLEDSQPMDNSVCRSTKGIPREDSAFRVVEGQ
jgi:hypothetical protein